MVSSATGGRTAPEWSAHQSFLGRLPPATAAEIAASGPVAHYPPGTIGYPVDGSWIAIVREGLLRYYLDAADGRQVTIRYLGPGDLIGSVAVGTSGVVTGVQAIGPSKLVLLDAQRLRSLAATDPDVGLALTDEITERLRFAYRALAASAFTTVRSRVARDLVERARASGRLEPGIHLKVAQQELADATGSVREVVARALRELRRGGLITTDRSGVQILDVAALERMH